MSLFPPLTRATSSLAVATMLSAAPAAAQDVELRELPTTQPAVQVEQGVTLTDSPAPVADDFIDIAHDALPLLWHVEGPAGQAWLLGTVHVGIDWDTMAPSVHGALSSSDIVAIETDVRAINPFELFAMAQATDDAPGVAYYFDDAQVSALTEQLDGLIPGPALHDLQPWFIMMMQMSLIVPNGELPLDMAVVHAGIEAGKDLRFLEEWQTQVGAISSMPVDYVVEAITETLTNPDSAAAELHGLVDAYAAGDAEQLESLVIDDGELAEWPDFFDVLLYNRNDAWVPTLESWMQDGTVFAAVGSGHLLGDRSVLSILEDRGYTVTRSGR
jgi:uncharacterized protein YbaP (TraB family)